MRPRFPCHLGQRTIAEEAALLDFPAMTLRDAIERPEALDTGTIMVTGLYRAAVPRGGEVAIRLFAARAEQGLPMPVPGDYDVTPPRVWRASSSARRRCPTPGTASGE